jgi:putative toxin-antitoxin system antitoxin component (TIGR02293 family)
VGAEAFGWPNKDDGTRLARVTDAALRIFGDRDFAHQWLNTANPALQGQVPIEMAETDAGARQVDAVLSRIAYGDYS